MFRPKLTKPPPSSPLAKAIGQLNRAVSNQSNIRPGPGMGIQTGPMGRMISLNTSNFILAMAKDVIPAARDGDDAGSMVLGRGEAFRLGMSLNDDGDYVLSPDDENPNEVYNTTTAAVAKGEWIFLAKILGVLMVIPEGGIAIARAKATETIPGGTFTTPSSSGEAQIYRKDSGGGWVASGEPVTVWNDHRVTSIPAGSTLKIVLIDGDWYLLAADCPS